MAKHHGRGKPAGNPPPEHERLHLRCGDPHVNIEVNMGDGPATPTAGFAGWEVISRVRRKGMTGYVGVPPFQQDVPVFLDGYADGESVEQHLAQLLSLGDDAVFWADGPIWRPRQHYVFGEEPEFGETIRAQDGTLVRQALTLKLMEYVPADVSGPRKKGNPKRTGGTEFPGNTYTVAQGGETLHEVAARLYGDWHEWRAIGKRNDIANPLRKLPARMVLKLP